MTRRGWCPSLYEPMESGDGWLVRIKPSFATLSADAATSLAQMAARFGSGVIELTNRANIQIRGLTVDSAHGIAREAAELGLASQAPQAERRRNVLVSPLAGADPSVAEGTRALAAAIEAMLVEDDGLAVLPGKFGIVVDGGGLLPVHDAPGDIRVQLRGHQARISLDGSDIAALCPEDEVVAAVRRLIQAFIDHRAARRMRELVPQEVFASAGLSAGVRSLASHRGNPVGPHAYGADGVGAFGFGLAFGQTDAPGLIALARLAGEHGDGTLRITPWRTILLPGIAPATATHPLGGSVITDPTDPALQVHACAGMPACPRATVATRSDGEMLARSGTLMGRQTHVSGCAKGCAHPGPATLTLVGEAGRYNLVRHGRADAVPVATGLSLAEAADLISMEDDL